MLKDVLICTQLLSGACGLISYQAGGLCNPTKLHLFTFLQNTGALLDHIGGHINPLSLIRRLPLGGAIPRLRDRVISIITDFRTQVCVFSSLNLQGCPREKARCFAQGPGHLHHHRLQHPGVCF
jgi:hypothetical protein